MFNLFDILQSQAGPGMQSIGQQFGLTPEQSRSAMNALLPALAAGLQRSAISDPMGFGRMLGMAGTEPYFGTSAQAQPPAQPDFFGQLFGSPMLSQAVLQQASSASGIGQQALRQMLPVMAGMVVAGIVHVLVNQPAPAPAQRHVPPPPPADGVFPVVTFWNDWINQFAGSPAPSTSKPSHPAPRPVETAPAPEPKSAPQEFAKPGTPQAEGADEAPFEAIQQMFQTGVQVQEQNAKAMQDIFDAFWSPSASPDASHLSSESQDGTSGAATTPDPSEPPKEGNSTKRTARQKGK